MQGNNINEIHSEVITLFARKKMPSIIKTFKRIIEISATYAKITAATLLSFAEKSCIPKEIIPVISAKNAKKAEAIKNLFSKTSFRREKSIIPTPKMFVNADICATKEPKYVMI